MIWAGIFDALLFIAAIILFFMGYGIAALICTIVAVVLLLIILGAKTDFLTDLADLVSDILN